MWVSNFCHVGVQFLELDFFGDLCGYSFRRATNLSSQMASHNALTCLHGQLNLLTTTLYKLASDIGLMSSGSSCG